MELDVGWVEAASRCVGWRWATGAPGAVEPMSANSTADVQGTRSGGSGGDARGARTRERSGSPRQESRSRHPESRPVGFRHELQPGRTVALSIGYLAVAVSVTAARESPMGYELSIYSSTPLVFWIGLAAALTIAALVGFAPETSSPGRLIATALVVLSGVAVAALPLLRGYHFFGGGDSLTHLGWARELADGSLAPQGLLYPGLHELSVGLASVTGAPLRRSMLFAVIAFVVVFLVSVPVCVRLLAGRRDGLLLGAFLAVLFVPINIISMHLLPHTSSQAVMFVPFALFVLLTYLVRTGSSDAESRRSQPSPSDDRTSPGRGIGGLLVLGTVATILVHPQQAANLLVAFVAITGLQLVARWFAPQSIAASHRSLLGQTILFAIAFALWAQRFDRVGGNATAMFANLLTGATDGTEAVAGKSTSLTAVGGSIPELFVKLFLTGAVVSGLTALLLYAAFTNRLARADGHRNQLVRYLGIAWVAIAVLFGFMFVASPGDMYFRYQGMLMVPATILGGVALARAFGTDGVAGRSRRIATYLLVLTVLVLLPLGIASMYPSPYVYQPNEQVTETDVEGYEHAFEVRASDVEFTGLRSGPQRYVDAYYGTDRARNTLEFPGYEDGLPPTVFREGIGNRFENDRYLAIGAGTRSIEVGLYGGFRYDDRGFDRLGTDPGVNRVVDTGGFDLYYLDGDPDGPTLAELVAEAESSEDGAAEDEEDRDDEADDEDEEDDEDRDEQAVHSHALGTPGVVIGSAVLVVGGRRLRS